MSTYCCSKRKPAILALADGTSFKGFSLGADVEASGEVVFNTSMSGYQEILTDPSYAFQILSFTCPHIGNVGVNKNDVESDKIQASGLIVREFSDVASNYRSEMSLQNYLIKENVSGISGVDTRALVLHLRTYGSQMGVISSSSSNADDLVDKAKALPLMEGLDLASKVSTKQSYKWTEGKWDFLANRYNTVSDSELESRPLVIAMDFGIKRNILRLLIEEGFAVKVVPANTSASEILSMNPNAVFLSNGPGDPAAVHYAIETIKQLIGKIPIFGICLGHQLLALALGASTYKLKFGHRGGNHPVRNELTSKVEITVQNHGFAASLASIPKSAVVTHINLNDLTVEGIEAKEAKAFSVQYHPESSPGPRDASYLFARFKQLVN